jgi:hypothetical protein
MRIGKNPAKQEGNNKVKESCFHQIIIPVHLPYLEGYYKDGLEILKLCLESIYLTVHHKTFISVINNGSCQEVSNYLNECLNHKKVNEVIHTSTIGKINAISKGLSGHNFDLVTITDADVLFTNGWQKAVYEIFDAFPKSGMVGTTPNSKMLKHFTENVHIDNLFNKNFKFRKVKNPDDMLSFGKSIDNLSIFKEVHLKNILSIKKEDTIGVVGSGHFTGTYRAELLKDAFKKYTSDVISPESDRIFLDKPSVKNGHWRLCTYDNFTYHLGNIKEDWMIDKLRNIQKAQINDLRNPLSEHKIKNCFYCILAQFIIRKLFFNKYLRKYYYQYLGLKKHESQIY